MASVTELEQKKALALAAARKRKAEADRGGAGGFLTRGMAEGLGGLFDLSYAAGRAARGLLAQATGGAIPASPPEEQAFLGSEQLSGFAQRAGLPVAPTGAQPTGLGESVAYGVGQTVGALPLAAAGAGAASMAPGLAGAVGQSMLQTAARHPVISAAMELASGAGMGAGGYAARTVAPGNPTAEAIGELMGGLALPATFAVAGRGVAGTAIRGAKAAIVPFTAAGAGVRAARRVGGLVARPETAMAALEAPTIAKLTPAQKIGDKRLLALERAVLDEDAKLDQRFAALHEQNKLDLINAIRGSGATGRPRAVIETRRDRLFMALDLRAKQAAAKAQQRLEKIAPRQRAASASLIVRQEIEKALADTRKQERALWAAVPLEARVGTGATIEAYDAIWAATPTAQRSDIPAMAKRLLHNPRRYDEKGAINKDFIGEENTVNELWGLRSKLLEDARQARSNGQWNKARIADELADGLLTDLGAAREAIEGPAGHALRTALDYSAALKETFERGAVGRMLGYGRRGGPKIPPELSLEATLGRGGAGAAVAARQITKAAPTAAAGGKDYVLNLFRQKTVKNDLVDPKSAQKFLEENADLVDQFPGLREDISDAASAQALADASKGRAKRAVALLSNEQKSYTARYLGSPVDGEIKRIIKSDNPQKFAGELWRQAGKDKTGGAAKGLKTALTDYLIEQSGASGKKLSGLIEDKKTAALINQWLTPAERTRLKQVASELVKIEASEGRLPKIGAIMSDLPSTLLSLASRTMGARFGAQLGKGTTGASLLTAHFFSRQAQTALRGMTNDQAKELLIQAVQDPELMAALLTSLTTPQTQKLAARRFNAWLAGPGLTIAESWSEE